MRRTFGDGFRSTRVWGGFAKALASTAPLCLCLVACGAEVPGSVDEPPPGAAAPETVDAPEAAAVSGPGGEGSDLPSAGAGRSGGASSVEADTSPLGLFGPVFPSLGSGNSHSTRCDPFEEDSESCF